MGLSVEISIGDSLGRLVNKDAFKRKEPDKSYSLETIGKLIHTIEVNDDLKLVGYAGLDLAYEAQKPLGKDVLAHWSWLRGMRNSVRSSLGKDRLPADFNEPERATDLMFGYAAEGKLASGKTEDGTEWRWETLALDLKLRPSEKRATLALSGTLGVGEVQGLVKAGFSKTIKRGPKPDTAALKKTVQEKKKAYIDLLDQQPVDKKPDCGGNADRDHELCKAGRDWQKASKDLEEAQDNTWRARLSAGHVGLFQLPAALKVLFDFVVSLFQ